MTQTSWKDRGRDTCIGLLLIGLFIVMSEYVNKPFRFFLKAQFPQVPYWLDHVLFMLTAKLVICVLLAWWLVGLRGLRLSRPSDPRAWRVAIVSGIGISVLIGLALFAAGAFQLQFQPNPLLMIGNLFSNFYEEVIYRGAILAILRKYLKSDVFAAIGSSVVFAYGHIGYPPLLLSLVFLSGIFWCYLTRRYQSIYPAYVSHCVMDWVSDTIFKS